MKDDSIISPWVPSTDPQTLRRLGKSCEELGELVSILGRAICQGLDGVDPRSGETNLDRITDESADVVAQINCNIQTFKLDQAVIDLRVAHKMKRMAEWEAMFAPVVDGASDV